MTRRPRDRPDEVRGAGRRVDGEPVRCVSRRDERPHNPICVAVGADVSAKVKRAMKTSVSFITSSVVERPRE